MTGLNIVRERYKIGMDLSGDSLILSVGQQWQMDQTRLTLLANEQDLGKNDINDQSLVFVGDCVWPRVAHGGCFRAC